MRALMQSGRALMRLGRASATCGPCCGPQNPSFFYTACPCGSYMDLPCGIPSVPCLYIDSRTQLSDSPLTLFQREDEPGVFSAYDVSSAAYSSAIVRIDGVCYALLNTLRHGEGPGTFPIPVGARRIGGTGFIIERRENCGEGCADVNVGPEYIEGFPCAGCLPKGDNTRYFFCARKIGSAVIFQTLSGGPVCVDQSIGYTYAQLASDPDNSSFQFFDDPIPYLVWQNVAQEPHLAPANSCCFWQGYGDCNPIDCLRGTEWRNYVLGWFPLDRCCGTQQGLSYGLDLFYSYRLIQQLGPGDESTFTQTVAVDSVTVNSNSVCFNFTLTNRTVRPVEGRDDTTTSSGSVCVEKKCCLLAHPELPFLTRFVPNSTPVRGEPSGLYYDREPIDPDIVAARRLAWFTSAFGGPFPLTPLDSNTTFFSSEGTTIDDDHCDNFIFRHSEHSEAPGHTYDVSISMTVRTIYDDSQPCINIGGCSSSGWGLGIEGLLP